MIWFKDGFLRQNIVWVFGALLGGLIISVVSFHKGRMVALEDSFRVKAISAPRYGSSLEVDNKPILKIEPLKSGWYVLVTMDKDADTVAKLKDLLLQNGFMPHVEGVNISNLVYYRLYVGPEDSKELAEKLLAELKRENYLPFDMRVTYVRQVP